MGRKKKNRGFEWVREDQDEDALERVERPNRTEARKRIQDLGRLATALAALSPGSRKQLPLDPQIIDALNALAGTGPTPDRRRKTLRAKSLLDEHEVDADALWDLVGGRR